MPAGDSNHKNPELELRFLNSQQIKMLDDALSTIEKKGFGCLRLVVEKGRLRFLVVETSYDALKYSPGLFQDE